MKNPIVQLIIGIIISAVVIYFTLKPINMADLWFAMKSFNWFWSIPFLIVTWISFYARAIRWRYLMKPIGEFKSSRLFSPMMAGFAINSLLPMRIGEFARAYVLARKEAVTFTATFATIVVERIFDSLMLLVLLVVVFTQIKIDPGLKLEYGPFQLTGEQLNQSSQKLAYLAILMLVGAGFLIWSKTRELMRGIVEKVPFAPQGIRMKISQLIHNFSDGLHSLRDFKSVAMVILTSLFVWITVGLCMQICAYAFPGMKMNLLQGIAITVITCVAIIIPAAPGYWGLMELGMLFGLIVMNIVPNTPEGKATALAYAFINHSLQIFPIIGYGLYCLIWKERISIGEIAHKPEEAV
ncbi:MAG: flippase-like domain-containing protein [Candidatus Sumerlaeaceae bacterium]|nr:flippase-like domain-containing protein [Candidatus Sumerlaeaceae bacterium]